MITDSSHRHVADCDQDPDQLDLFGSSAEVDLRTPPRSDANGELLCRFGHDLRTALNIILGFSEIMTQRLHGPLGHPKYDEYAAHVRFSGQELLTVTDEMLALAGRGLLTSGGPMQRA